MNDTYLLALKYVRKERKYRCKQRKDSYRGLIGLAFGHLLNKSTRNKLPTTILGAAVGAAMGSMKEARENGVDVYGKEDGWLVKISPNGAVEKIRQLVTHHRKVIQHEYTIR